MIGFGQVGKISKDNNDTQLKFSLGTGLTIQTGLGYDNPPNEEWAGKGTMLTVFYFKGNTNYDISLNRKFYFYNRLSLVFKYRNGGQAYNTLWDASYISHPTIPYYNRQDDVRVTFEYASLLKTQLFYSGGIEMMISEKLKHRFGGRFILLSVFSSESSTEVKIQDNDGNNWVGKYPSRLEYFDTRFKNRNWRWNKQGTLVGYGGINYEIDYLLSNKLSVNFSLERILVGNFRSKDELFLSGFHPGKTTQDDDWITDISLGAAYSF
tara:strand:- start:3 stop:800 length:798 start_codon:yes stop_codon:yes gene_type:complete